jgi:PAS domain S-box-containing protein
MHSTQRSDACRTTSTESVAAERPPKSRIEGLDAARARAIIDNARDAIISIDNTGKVLHFNKTAERMFGWRADEVIGGDVTVLMPSPDREQHAEYVARYERTGEARAIGRIRDVYALRKDGTVFPAELAVSEARFRETRIYTAIIRDVTDYRVAIEGLRRERDFSERLIETSPFIVLVLDRDARILRFNRSMSDVTGYDLAEVERENWFERFIPTREEATIRAVFERAMSGVPVRGNVNPIRTKSGEERTIRWYAEPLRDAEGRVESVLCGGEDITEQLRAAEEVQRLARVSRERERLADLGAIAARIVHDLGNPISGLSMQAQLLIRRVKKQQGPSVETLVQPAERILAAVERLNTLIRGFMDFAREQRLDLEDVDVRALVDSVLDPWTPLGAERGIAVEIVCDGPVGSLRCDPAKLKRVFENLVKNALDAIGTGPGHVRVTITKPNADVVQIAVTDDGPGVATDVDVFRLFETTKPLGTGIGLAVAKQIVVAHGGGIEFANVHPHGAAFHIELPVAGPTGGAGGAGR